jgi:hypothetical protein
VRHHHTVSTSLLDSTRPVSWTMTNRLRKLSSVARSAVMCKTPSLSVTPHGLRHGRIALISEAQHLSLTEHETSGGVDSAHIDLFSSRVFGSSTEEMGDGEADNTARHRVRCCMMDTICPLPAAGDSTTQGLRG